jgi:hypothetical protein
MLPTTLWFEAFEHTNALFWLSIKVVENRRSRSCGGAYTSYEVDLLE